MQTTRRLFLKSGALALASVGLAPGWGPRFLRGTVFADEALRPRRQGTGRKVMVCIFQRGAVDGLSMVVPHGDPAYYQHRVAGAGGIAIPRTGEDAVLDLDGTFGLHPALAMLKPIYDAGFLAPIQAVGSPSASRSHFDAQDYMESALPGDKTATEGWLTRALEHCPEDTAKRAQQTLRAVALTPQLPRSLMGDPNALALGDLGSFGIGAQSVPPRPGRRNLPAPPAATGGMSASDGFEALYEGAVGDVLHGAGQETFEALKMLKGLNPAGYVPANNAHYPPGAFGNSMKQIAQLIKGDVGLEVAFAEIGGWDTHAEQGGSKGALARRLTEFGGALAAFYADLGDSMADVTVLTMSEFGRTVRQNGRNGTDHGHGTCFFAMGGNVQGGKVLGRWPGLAPEQLYENRDLAVTTDFRAIFGEVAGKHLGMRDLTQVFPGITPTQLKGPTIIRA